MTAANTYDIKLGLTLYSLTNEWAAGQFDTASILDHVGNSGIGPGVEIVASQTIRSYPYVTDEFERVWKDGLERNGLTATSFGMNLDMGRRVDRDMTPDEEFEFSKILLDGAHRLGFSIARIQTNKRELLSRLLPIAEKYDIRMGTEIHAPSGPNDPSVLKIRELYADFDDSPYLGFVADMSSTMRGVSPAALSTFRARGLPESLIEDLREIWPDKTPGPERYERWEARAKAQGVDLAELLGPFARLTFNMHGNVDPQEWLDIMPQIVHVHAKFYDIDEYGDEPAVDYPAIVNVFAEGGYHGYFSSEWEGHAWFDLGQADPTVLVQRQHDLISRTLSELAPGLQRD